MLVVIWWSCGLKIPFLVLVSAANIRVKFLLCGSDPSLSSVTSTVKFCPSRFLIRRFHKSFINIFSYFYPFKHINRWFKNKSSKSKPGTKALSIKKFGMLCSKFLFNYISPIFLFALEPVKIAKYSLSSIMNTVYSLTFSFCGFLFPRHILDF